MSLIADALKKAQTSRLARRYRTDEPTGALPPVDETNRGGLGVRINSLLKGQRVSPTLGLGLAAGTILFVVLVLYFFYGPGQRTQSRPSVAKHRPVELILTPPPSVPALEPLDTEQISVLPQKSLPVRDPLVGEVKSGREGESGIESGEVMQSPRRARRKAIRQRATHSKVTVTSDQSDEVRRHFNLALEFQEKREYMRAKSAYEKVIEIWPLYAEAHNNLGLVFKELGQHSQAIDHFERALALNPGYVRAYHNLGVIYHLKGDLKRAIKNYQAALTLDKRNLSSMNNLGLIYREENRLYDAREILEKALVLKPAFPQTRYNLALVLEGLGEYREARLQYQKFVALSGENNRELVNRVEEHLRNLPLQKP